MPQILPPLTAIRYLKQRRELVRKVKLQPSPCCMVGKPQPGISFRPNLQNEREDPESSEGNFNNGEIPLLFPGCFVQCCWWLWSKTGVPGSWPLFQTTENEEVLTRFAKAARKFVWCKMVLYIKKRYTFMIDNRLHE